MSSAPITRRAAVRRLAVGLAAPAVYRAHAAAPSETLLHASFGADGMAFSDIQSLAASKHFRLVAVAEVDDARLAKVKKRFPDVRVYRDWRQLLDKEKDLQSVNVSTPDHMHAPITLRAIRQGLHVYTQKPLTQTVSEARRLTRAAADAKVVTQMGIQIHSHEVHRTVVAIVRSGAIGKVRAVHSWSGKQWGDPNPRPARTDPVPATFDWDGWLGVAADRPFVRGYYHPGEWRKRLDFGTGTFGDMGCHILDPVYAALGLTAPTAIKSTGDAPNADSWGLDTEVAFTFPGTPQTADALTLTWYNGNRRPPMAVQALIGMRPLSDQGSIYVGDGGVLYSPYIAPPVLLPEDKFKGADLPKLPGENHYLQFVEACRGNGRTSAPFGYSGPLTEAVLLGCLATRFPGEELRWDAAGMTVTNVPKANAHVRRAYRKGWEVEGA
jgi:predicted dehydrogenase